MGNHDRKKKRRDSSSSNSSDSSSESNEDLKQKSKSGSDCSPEYSKKNSHKAVKRKSVSSSGEEDVKRNKHVKKEERQPARVDKVKKTKFEDPQKSKWDSPADNVPKSLERKKEKETHSRKSPDRDELKEHRKHHDRYKHERRDDNKNRNYHRHNDNRNRHENDRKDRGRPDRRDNDERYRSGRQKSRERSRSRENQRKDDYKREDSKFRNRRNQRRNDNSDHENYDWGKKSNEEKKPPAEKEKPNFGLSGKLTEETNTYRGVVIKYSEPAEARKPKRRWRLYPFKGEKALPTLYIHRESAYLMGRDRKVVDFPLDHPSCSKQHAVLQYRLVPFTRDDGSVGKKVRPYIIDLDSANGTFINNKKIDPRKFVELLEKDVIKFGYSSREYVLLHENSKDEGLDDDVKQEEDEVVVKDEAEES